MNQFNLYLIKNEYEMKIKMMLFFVILMLSSSVYSQDKLEKGRYLTSDKLKYITLKDNFQFEYQSYKGYSPYTIKEKREKESTPQMCGTVGYISNGNGRGTYSIENGKILLKFEIDYSTITTKKIDIHHMKELSFEISELEKLESEN